MKWLTLLAVLLSASPAGAIVLSPELGTTKAPYGIYQTKKAIIYPSWESEFMPKCPTGVNAIPDCNPCPVIEDKEKQARCWIEAAFPKQEVELAMRVAEKESAYTFSPTIKNPKSSATGLFQHIKRFWKGRVNTFYPGAEMSRTNGWHNTLIAARLVERDSWNRHWQVCRGFAINPGTLNCG